MAINENYRLLAKKHLGYAPTDTCLDTDFANLDSGSNPLDKEEQFIRAVDKCESWLLKLETAHDEADELTSGGGATFNYPLMIKVKQDLYELSVNELCRQLDQPLKYPTGSGAQCTGWNRL